MNPTQATPSLLEQILTELDENHLATLYDEPIQKCCLTYIQTHEEPTDFTTFNQSLTDFIILVFNEALPLKINLTQEQSFGKAKRLLDHHYPGGGYERAYLDATLPHGASFTTVLNTLAQAARLEERTKHLAWVFEKHAYSWPLRNSLAAEVMDHYPPLLAPQFRNSPRWLFTNDIPQLVLAIADSGQTLTSMTMGSP